MQKIISDLINHNNFLTLDDFIYQAMCHNKHGYYSKQNPIKKDFITSPEITDAFGIIIASNIINTLLKVNFNNYEKINICEFGGGTGKLAFDILHFILGLKKLNNERINKLIEKINYTSLEFSEKLIIIQEKTLHKIIIKKNFIKNIQEFTEKENNKNNITIFISNEFFDALPIKQFIFENGKFYEIVIIKKNHEFIFSKIEINNNVILNNYFNLKNIPNNAIIELPITGINILESIIHFSKNNKLIFMTFDYGFIKNNFQNTLQGIFQNKKTNNILENIGDADITHLVNFELFKNILAKHQINTKIQTQQEFLMENGIINLIHTKNKDGINRILDKNQMGELFKVLYFNNF